MNWRYKTPVITQLADKRQDSTQVSLPPLPVSSHSFFAVSIFVFKFTVKLTDEL